MISPTESLVFSMHANPGVYAILAGSGVSRAAKIPTGWDITLDLVRKLAVLHEEKCEPDPEQWYRNTFGKEPDYSDLLDAVCKTPTERQQLLRPYVEPSIDEREDGAKQPTAAHRAVAALVAQGFIRLIVTTNFDLLFETALEDADVKPVVLSTRDQVHSALPLIHTSCSVVKLHGDYRDPRIRNTRAELDCYDEEFDQLLDRIFDEFGLVVCGWSAAWDAALRNALYRARSRRFTTYWATHGPVEEDAQQLINHRQAELIPIKDADKFFTTLQEGVQSLHEFARPHPLSTEAAVASLKRYLTEPPPRIRFSDLVDDIVERVVETTSGDLFALDHPSPDTVSVTARVRRYEAVCSMLLAVAAVAGVWLEEEHVAVWQRALSRLGSTSAASGNTYWLTLRTYPATLLLYALGIGAIQNGRLHFLGRLLETPIRDYQHKSVPAVQVLPPSCLFNHIRAMHILEGMDKRKLPLNDWLCTALRTHTMRVVPDERRYEFIFDQFEMLVALNYIHLDQHERYSPWAPLGAFSYRLEKYRIDQEIEESLSVMQVESPFLKCGLFGHTVDLCKKRLAALREFLRTVRFF